MRDDGDRQVGGGLVRTNSRTQRGNSDGAARGEGAEETSGAPCSEGGIPTSCHSGGGQTKGLGSPPL